MRHVVCGKTFKMRISDYKIQFKDTKETELLLKYAIVCVCGGILETDKVDAKKASMSLLSKAEIHARECTVLNDLKTLSLHSKDKHAWVEWIRKYIK